MSRWSDSIYPPYSLILSFGFHFAQKVFGSQIHILEVSGEVWSVNSHGHYKIVCGLNAVS